MGEWRHQIRAAQTGDIDAFGPVVREFQDMAVAYAFSILGSFELAEDAAQEAFIQAYHDLKTLREPQAFPAWLRRLVFKHCDRQIRGKRLKTVPLDAVLQAPSEAPDPMQATVQRELRQRVIDAIRSLPEHERSAVSLFYINGYSQAEVGEFLDVPAKTVKSRLYSARKKLRERMVDMVEDTLKVNAPADSFTKATIDKIVGQAEELIKQRELKEAEELLRKGLAMTPDHPPALLLLNRSLMGGGVYKEDRWDLLPEIAENGRKILASGDADEYIRQQTAITLLAIPAMKEACSFITEWIDKHGANLERIGMLAWAQGCVAEYGKAENTWKRFLKIASDAADEVILKHFPISCASLVDCLVAADQNEVAHRVVLSAWDALGHLRIIADQYPNFTWPHVFDRAGLGSQSAAIARESIEALGPEDEMTAAIRSTAFRIRIWMDDEETIRADWLKWVKESTTGEVWQDLGPAHGYYQAGDFGAARRVAQATWDLLKGESRPVPESEESMLNQFRFPAGWYLFRYGDAERAERIAREAIAEGYETWWVNIADVAIHRGEPSPPKLMAYLMEKDPEDPSLDYDRYHIAREAAARGDKETAFGNLERALMCWYNPPLWTVDVWERDVRWGELRDHPDFKRLFAEKRQRIGPIKGSLWHFPGWVGSISS